MTQSENTPTTEPCPLSPDTELHFPNLKYRKMVQWKYVFKTILNLRWYINKIRVRRVIKKTEKFLQLTKDYKFKEILHHKDECSIMLLCKTEDNQQRSMQINYPKEAALEIWAIALRISLAMGFVLK